MMLRCTSPVPPPTVSAGANRKPWCHRSAAAPRGPWSVSIPCGAGEVLGQAEHLLAVLVGQRLADRRLGPGGFAPDGGGDRAQPDEPQDLGLDVQRGRAAGAAAGRRCRPAVADEVEQVVRRRAHAPQRAAARQRHPLVAERDLGQRPAVVLVADEVLGRHADVVEEHLVERVRAGHLDDRAGSSMPGQVHRADEVRDALVLGRVGIGAGDEDAEAGELGQRRPDLLAVDHPLVAVAHGPRAQVGQVATRRPAR